MNKCDKCGQLLIDIVSPIKYNEENLCSECIKKINGDIIKFKFPGDDDYTYLPLQPNLEKGYYKNNPLKPNGDWNGRTWKEYDNFIELYNHWTSIEWGYSKYNTPEVELTSFIREGLVLQEPNEFKEDWEFEIIGFKELMINGGFYDTPWDNEPNSNSWFISYFTEDCMKGQEYTKDFSYFDCPECHRTICEQNPSNGWRGQYMIQNDEQICVKCWQESMLENGIDFENLDKDEDVLKADFFNHEELEKHGFKEYISSQRVGSGYTGYTDPKEFINLIWKLHEDNPNWKIICDIDSMAIGGLGGYCSIYYKEKENED